MTTPHLERCVRYTSGASVCEEGLVDGQWVGLCQRIEGRQAAPAPLTPLPAFELDVLTSPDARTPWSLTTGWQWVAADELDPAGAGRRHWAVTLSSARLPLTVTIHTVADGTPVLTRWLRIENAAAGPVAITAVDPWSGRLWNGDAPVRAGYSVIQHDQRTGSFGWRTLPPGVTAVENLQEPCYDDPYFILHNTADREFFFGQLAWPSLYAMAFGCDRDGISFRIGPRAAGGVLRVVAAGESVDTPAVHLGHTTGDLDDAVQEMHAHIRRSVLPSRAAGRAHRITYVANGDTGTCLYTGEDFNERHLRPCIDVAAAVGAELFLIDGPFWAEPGGKHGYLWEQGSRRLFPAGMRALRDYAHEQGVLFGLYCRTEGKDMLSSGHPDMHDATALAITAHGLDLYRHDTSADQWADWVHTLKRDGFDECVVWRHHAAFYQAVERIHREYQDVVLQQAAGGGARSDLATAARFHEHFQSDNTGVPYVWSAMAGFSVYLPPEVMQASYHGMNHEGVTTPNRETLMRAIFTLGNVPAIYWTQLPATVDAIDPEDLRQWRKYVALYTSFIRPMLPTCKVYHHAPIDESADWDAGHWLAMEYAAPDRARAWATIIRFPGSPSDTYQLLPKGLDPGKTYAVTLDTTGRTEIMAGAALRSKGLTIRIAEEQGSELVLFTPPEALAQPASTAPHQDAAT